MGCHLPLRMCMSSQRLIMLVVASEAGTCSVTKSDPLSSSFRLSTGALFPMGICIWNNGSLVCAAQQFWGSDHHHS